MTRTMLAVALLAGMIAGIVGCGGPPTPAPAPAPAPTTPSGDSTTTDG